MRLQGKTAIITGGANGIGKATVKKFLAHGANVVFTDINEQAGAAAQQEFQSIGGGHSVFVKHDVQKEEDWALVVRTAKEKFGRIDTLFNNAGIYSAKPIPDYSVEEWQRLLGINVIGVFLGIKHVVPEMRAGQGGSIINASSIAGLKGQLNHSLYGASKGAVRILTKDAAIELAADQIRVNSVHPGVIQTEMGDAVASGFHVTTDQLAAGIPMKRVGAPDDIANMVVFLASDEAAYITGTEMVVDGGATAK
ncbi:SDR family NAD(P)-dependent oxidoreductase [Paenibacillus sp. GCM10027627]|uniref:SDR family NAD(P)-dependent oxidoreductase n=1 Tax=unclassified Paenibacillus TaxID=185978 RepID=UPI003635F02A